MAREKATRRRGNCRRARVTYRDDTNIVAENIESEWEKGCRWAGIAFALTWGPMMAMGVWFGW